MKHTLVLVLLALLGTSQAEGQVEVQAEVQAEGQAGEQAEDQSARCGWTPTAVSGTHAPGHVCAGDLVFQEEFHWFNSYTWRHEHMGVGANNGEFQWYDTDESTCWVENGVLHIRPTFTGDDNAPVKSARITGIESFGFTYGRVEIAAKMPAGDWLWPAIWMMPTYSVYGGWPTSGEIDLVESRGNRDMYINDGPIGVQEAASTLHFGPFPDWNGWYLANWQRIWWPGFHLNFHRYQFEWTPDQMIFSIDDIELGRIDPGPGGFWQFGGFNNDPNLWNPWQNSKMAPFDHRFYFIMNVAVGGTNGFFPDGVWNPSPKPWWNGSPSARHDFWNARDQWIHTWNMHTNDAALQVDYIRVWAL